MGWPGTQSAQFVSSMIPAWYRVFRTGAKENLVEVHVSRLLQAVRWHQSTLRGGGTQRVVES